MVNTVEGGGVATAPTLLARAACSAFARHLGYLLGWACSCSSSTAARCGACCPHPACRWQGPSSGALGGILAAWLLHSGDGVGDDL